MSDKKYLEVARVTGTHGVRGMVRLENLTDSTDVLSSIRTVYRKRDGVYSPLHIERASEYKGALLTAFREITALEDAIPMKGEYLFALREDIPTEEGAVFIADMIGLDVIDEANTAVGRLKEVITPAGRQVYIIEKPDGTTFMMPAVPEFVLEVETEGDFPHIRVHLIDGMAD